MLTRAEAEAETIVALLDEPNARGMIIRVGQCAQGVLHIGSKFSVERWELNADGRWGRVIRLGQHYIPCHVTFDVNGVGLNDKVRFGDLTWEVVEKT